MYVNKLCEVYLCTVTVYTFWNSNAVYVVRDLHSHKPYKLSVIIVKYQCVLFLVLNFAT